MATCDTPPPADNRTLSAKRPYRETPDVAAAVGRLVRTVGRRVATEDPVDLEILVDLTAALDEAWRTAIAGLRATGHTDGDIGAALGVSKQAVAQRFPRNPPPADA